MWPFNLYARIRILTASVQMLDDSVAQLSKQLLDEREANRKYLDIQKDVIESLRGQSFQKDDLINKLENLLFAIKNHNTQSPNATVRRLSSKAATALDLIKLNREDMLKKLKGVFFTDNPTRIYHLGDNVSNVVVNEKNEVKS